MAVVTPSRSYSKSLKSSVLCAFHLGKVALPTYSHLHSRKDFTGAQLFALLVLRALLKTDYRGVIQFLKDFPDVQHWLDLKRVPHYSTLSRAAKRIGRQFDRLLDASLAQACARGSLQRPPACCA